MSYSATRRKRFTAGVLAGAMAFTVMPILGFTGTAGAAHLETADPIGDGNVCEDAPETDPFTDVTDADPAVEEIRCMANTEPEITKGTTATTYSPNASTQRGQMALFLERVADLAEANETSEAAITELPAGDGETPFTDIGDWPAEHQDAIDRLEDAGITEGVTPTEFRPGTFVSRRQMAKFIVRLQNFLAGEDFEFEVVNDCTDCFDDDNGDSGEAELNTLAREGVFIGVAGSGAAHNVEPGEDITRRQMAFVLTRKLEVLFEAGLIDRLFEEDDVAASTNVRPELRSAEIVSTTTTAQSTPPSNPAGTVVRYTFDEAVGAVTNPANFNLYRFNDPNTQLSANTASIDPNNANAVLARFNALTNDPGVAAASTADLSVATVDIDAVTDTTGLQNPEGDAAVGSGQQTATLAAGRTLAPDLVSVSGFRQAQAASTTAVDFVFDQVAYTQTVGGAGFMLVQPNNNEIVCTGPADNDTTVGGAAVPGGNGTTTITVTCPNPGGQTTPMTVSQVARGTVDAGSVGTTPAAGVVAFPGVSGIACGGTNAQGTVNRCNPLEASDSPNTGTVAPDLVSVRFVAATTPGGTETAIFTFDQAVATAGAGTLFQVYQHNTTEVPGGAPVSINTGGDSTEVAVTFPNGTIANATGGNVLDGAATGTGGQANEQDEAAATNVQQPAPAGSAGRTAAPDLVSVALSEGGTFGNQWRATYTFDEAIATAPGAVVGTPNLFRLYGANGQGFAATACTAGPAVTGTAAANSVICTGYDRFTSPSNPAASGTAATNAEISSATLGTVDNNAVVDGTPHQNPEGAEATTGGTGTPA